MTNVVNLKKSRRAFGEAGAAAEALRRKLMTIAPGATITWKELSEVAGTTERPRSAFQTARRQCEAEGVVFASIQDVGYRRAIAHEIADISAARHKHVRRTIRRAAKEQATVTKEDRAAMTLDQRARYDAQVIQTGIIALATKPSAAAKIEQEVRAAKVALPKPEDMLSLFKGKKD